MKVTICHTQPKFFLSLLEISEGVIVLISMNSFEYGINSEIPQNNQLFSTFR